VGRILVIGGYGAFGARVSERLSREPNLEVIVAGRREDAASAYAAELARTARAAVSHAALDAATATAKNIRSLGAAVLINASGPFQGQSYGLARACIASRCHYVDLADARAFVTGITRLDADARAAGVCVISGASSVPGLSSAVVESYAGGFQGLDAVEIGISPGNSFDPGLATTESILGAVGAPHAVLENGRRQTAYGWQGLRRHRFPGIGARLMSSVDVPDLDLLPEHFPSLKSVRFSAGVEVPAFHLMLWTLAGLRRAGLVRNPGRLAAPLLGAKRMLRFLGSDNGAMFVTLRGRDAQGEPRSIEWTLIARSGDGPYVPAMAAVILAKRLAEGSGPAPGAQPCFALFTLADFEAEATDLDITFHTRSR
jgi:saccharopine dehydrogenase-like NADP-dependent oxidoreductase